MSPAETNEQLALVTCSYQPDFERCARLCSSMDTFECHHTPHFIVVPERDRRLFSRLASTHRTVLSTEDVLPRGFTQMPLLRKWWLDGGLWPVRGWMMQQLTKLSADRVTERENIMFIDSDIEFIRQFQAARFFQREALRLHRKPMAMSEGVHLKWHHAAADLLDLPRQYFGSDYIAPLATWKRSNLVRLKGHIEACTNRPWQEAIGRRTTVSEYILYGVFVEHVLGMEHAGHFSSSEDICHSLWFGGETEQFLAGFDAEDPPQAVLLQSNIGLDQNEVTALMGRLQRKAAFT